MARTTRTRTRRSVAAPLVALVLAGCGAATERGVTPSAESPSATTAASSPSTAPTASPSEADELEPVGERLRLAPPDGGSFVVHGRFPLTPSPCLDPDPTTLAGRFP